jgi:hypothetical protein
MDKAQLGNKIGDLIELKGFPISLEYFIEEFDYCYRVQVAFPTQCRDDGHPIKLYLYYSYGKDQYSKVEAVRTALIESLTHEIDECFLVDGERVFDPHNPDKLHL